MVNRKLSPVIAAVMAIVISFLLPACDGNTVAGGAGGGNTYQGAAPASIKIGIPTPISGNISGYGKGSPYVQQLVVDKVNAQGGIYIKEYGRRIPIEIVVKDTQSDQNRAGQVAEKMVTDDHVTMLIAQHSAENTIPTIMVAERYGIPCVSNGCPTNLVKAVGPFKWTYHAFWDITDAITSYTGLWKQLGYGAGTRVGFLFPSDPDALAWIPVAYQISAQKGFSVANPGTYPIGNKDWTATIDRFKRDYVRLILGSDIASDFSSFVTQSIQQGFQPETVTMARANIFPADVNALPMSVATGLTSEVWWAPSWPFKSSLDGTTCRELADKWMQYSNDDWYETIGDKYSAMEVCVDALKRAGSLNPSAIRDALAATDLDTISGHIQYDQETHIGVTPVTVGQWFPKDAGHRVVVKIVYTGRFADVQPEAVPFRPTQTWTLEQLPAGH